MTGRAGDASTPLCVYAIVGRRFGRRVAMRGIRAGGARLRAVNAAATSAMVAERAGPLLPTVRALRAHDAVVRRTARIAPAVLPVRFGTLVASDHSLVALLDEWSDELLTALTLVDGRCQMTLRLFARAGAVAPPRRAAAPGTAESRSREVFPGRGYLEGRARAQARAQSAPELEPLREALAPIVAAERITRHDQGPLLLTAYHLIPRGAATGVPETSAAPCGAASRPRDGERTLAALCVRSRVEAMKKKKPTAAAARHEAPARADIGSPRTASASGHVGVGLHDLAPGDLDALRAELERSVPPEGGAARWNADPADVQRSVAKLVLTLMEFLRKLLERQAIRRMESRTLTDAEVEAVGLALMRLEETLRTMGERFGLAPDELNLDLGPLGRLI